MIKEWFLLCEEFSNQFDFNFVTVTVANGWCMYFTLTVPIYLMLGVTLWWNSNRNTRSHFMLWKWEVNGNLHNHKAQNVYKHLSTFKKGLYFRVDENYY